MGILIGLFAKMGLGPRLAALAGYGLVALAVVGALWWLRHDAYNDGERAENARWEAALDEAEEQAETAADQADVLADTREEEFAETVKEEKERIDAAVEAGTDPFDVLFPGG